MKKMIKFNLDKNLKKECKYMINKIRREVYY